MRDTARRCLWIALLAGLGTAGEAGAHAIGLEATLWDGEVHVEAFFDDGSAARDARVTVVGPDGREVAAGRTDDDGRWSFPAPAVGRYTVSVDAADGHSATRRITIPATEEEEPGQVSEGPTREEFTAVPWKGIALGLGVFALIGLVSLALQRKRVKS